jgi:hypothetical protein
MLMSVGAFTPVTLPPIPQYLNDYLATGTNPPLIKGTREETGFNAWMSAKRDNWQVEALATVLVRWMDGTRKGRHQLRTKRGRPPLDGNADECRRLRKLREDWEAAWRSGTRTVEQFARDRGIDDVVTLREELERARGMKRRAGNRRRT